MLRIASFLSSLNVVNHNSGLDFHKRILFSTGLWLQQDQHPGVSYYLRYCLPRLQVALASILGTVVFPVGVYANLNDITAMFDCISSTCMASMILVKIGHLLYQSEKFQRLVQTTEEICCRSHGDTERERRIRNNTQILTDFTIVTDIIAIVFSFSVSFGSIPYYLSIRKNHLGGWYPFDEYATPYFEITLVLMSITLCSSYGVVIIDTLFAAILIQLIGQFKMLRHNLTQIRQSSNEAVDVKMQNDVRGRSHLKHFEESDHVRIFELDADDLRTSSAQLHVPKEESTLETVQKVALCPFTPQQMLEDVNKRDEEINLEMNRRLKDCIKHHQELCRLKDDIQSTFHDILVHQLMFCFVLSVSIVIWLTMVETIFDVRALGFFVVIMASMVELFVFCYLANKVTEEDTKVKEAVYGIEDWYEASKDFKKAMCIIITKCNRPLVMNVAGFIPLSMETSFNVVNLIYSYYTTLRTTINGQQH